MNITYMIITLLFAVVATTIIQAQPINDQCDDAIVVDPSTNITIFGNTTGASTSLFFDASYYGLYYKIEKNEEITNTTSGMVCSNTTGYYPEVFLLTGDDCDDGDDEDVIRNFYSFDECVTFDFPEKDDETYQLFVTIINDATGGSVESNFEMTLRSELRYTPPNDECEEAILVDPLVGGTYTGNTTASVSGSVFYAFNEESGNDRDVTIEICKGSTTTPTIILDVFKGPDCVSSEFMERYTFNDTCNTMSFVARKNSRYEFIIGLYNTDLTNVIEDTYSMTISSKVAKCGLFGFNLFCFRSNGGINTNNRCGFFQRLFGFGNCENDDDDDESQ